MADISKQVSEGQKKWRQGVDVMSTSDVNDYIKFKILEYGYFDLMKNNDMWEQYQEDFADFTEAIFKTCDRIATYNLRTLLRHKVYGLISKLLLHSFCTTHYARKTKWNGLKRKS